MLLTKEEARDLQKSALFKKFVKNLFRYASTNVSPAAEHEQLIVQATHLRIKNIIINTFDDPTFVGELIIMEVPNADRESKSIS